VERSERKEAADVLRTLGNTAVLHLLSGTITRNVTLVSGYDNLVYS
jgi:hypothetical protein